MCRRRCHSRNRMESSRQRQGKDKQSNRANHGIILEVTSIYHDNISRYGSFLQLKSIQFPIGLQAREDRTSQARLEGESVAHCWMKRYKDLTP